MPANYGPSRLDKFDEPVRKILEKAIKEIRQEPSSLSVLIDRAIEAAKELVGSGDLIKPPTMLIAEIALNAYTYVSGALGQSKKWNDVRGRIKIYHSIFLVGAGVSYESSIPLARHLSDLLGVCRVRDYCELNGDSEKCYQFKKDFKKICEDKPIGASHRLIALNFPKHIREIICLNWDNMIEKAYKECHNMDIPKINEEIYIPHDEKGYLWKFHGDVENIKEDNIRGQGGWIFPDEEGYIFDCFHRYVEANLSTDPFVFIIAGYSESDSEICDNIIECFESDPPRQTFRIGLNLEHLNDSNYIVGTPDFILPKILPITTP